MALFDRGTDSPTASGWQRSPRQTHLCENNKTIISRAVEIDAKLGTINNADWVGDAHHFVPEPDSRCQHSARHNASASTRATDSPTIGRTGSSSADGQIGLVRHAEALLSRVRASRSRFHGEATATRSAVGALSRGESVSPQTVGRTAPPGRQRQSAGHVPNGDH
jgi:hypothetical protein